MDNLPIFRITTDLRPKFTSEKLTKHLSDNFGLKKYSKYFINGRQQIRSPDYLVDLDPNNGSLWISNTRRLLDTKIDQDLPTNNVAQKIANEYLSNSNPVEIGDLAMPNDVLEIEHLEPIGSYFASLDLKTNERNVIKIDSRVRYQKQINSDYLSSDFQKNVPIIGKEGKIGIAIGKDQRVIEFNNTPLHIEPGPFNSKISSRKQVDKQFEELTKNIKIQSYDSSLWYVVSHDNANPEKKYLAPYWAYKSVYNRSLA